METIQGFHKPGADHCAKDHPGDHAGVIVHFPLPRHRQAAPVPATPVRRPDLDHGSGQDPGHDAGEE